MKLAIAGKGGVGKTTLVALLAREAAARGYRVITVDADPDANLAMTLGFPEPIIPLAEEWELIADRAGTGGLIKLNPTVDDIPDRYSVEQDGIRLLVLGGIRQGGAGCACPANALLRSLLRHLFPFFPTLITSPSREAIQELFTLLEQRLVSPTF